MSARVFCIFGTSMLGCARYPSPASTKSPMGTLCSQLSVVPGPRWIPAYDGHPTPLDTPFGQYNRKIKTVTAGGRGSPPLRGGFNSSGSLRFETPDFDVK